MSFAWTNLSKSTMRELARGAGLKVTKAEVELRSRYGEPPSPEFVTELWPVLRDGWVTREPVAREMIVEGLRAARLGKTDIEVKSRAGQMRYIRSCRMSETLRTVVLEALNTVGSLPYDLPAAAFDVPEEEQELPIVEWLRRACAALTPASLPVVELAVCLGIGRALQGVNVPVSDEDRPDLVAEIVTAAVLAAHGEATSRAEVDDPALAHRVWVLEGAQRLATDRTAREQAVMAYQQEVDKILASDMSDTFNASMTCLSMFFTVIAFGAGEQITPEQSVELIGGLSWLLQVVAPSGADAPTEVTDNRIGSETAEPSSVSTASADSPRTLVEYIDARLQQIPGLIGPSRVDDENVFWLLPAGSAVVQVLAREPGDRLPLLRLTAQLISGVRVDADLLVAVNNINAAEEYAKAYVVDDRVTLEYDQIVDELSSSRFDQTVGHFMRLADHFDSVLQDRFGGQTHAAAVKAQFRA